MWKPSIASPSVSSPFCLPSLFGSTALEPTTPYFACDLLYLLLRCFFLFATIFVSILLRKRVKTSSFPPRGHQYLLPLPSAVSLGSFPPSFARAHSLTSPSESTIHDTLARAASFSMISITVSQRPQVTLRLWIVVLPGGCLACVSFLPFPDVF